MIERTLFDIDKVITRLNTHPEYSTNIKNQLEQGLREDALSHSLKLEGIGTQINQNGNLCKTARCNYHEAYSQLSKAKDYLVLNDLNLSTLAMLGHIIEPITNPIANFRNTTVAFGEFYGEGPTKIPYKIKSLIDRLNLNEVHPILNSIDAHLELIKIHPYVDGNGRAARLVQDFILENNGYPAPIITEGERELYIHMMRLTIRDRVHKRSSVLSPSESEILLYSFISSKILNSTLSIEKELQKKRIYEIKLEDMQSPNISFTISKEIKGLNRAQSREGVVVRNSKEEEGKKIRGLYVCGDISTEEIDIILKRHLNKGYSSYRLRSIRI